MKNENCWANSLDNCSEKISREHIISDSILAQKIRVQGFSWCKDEPKTIGKGSFTSKILCEYHNNLLSPYDTEARNFVKVIEDFNRISNRMAKHGFSVKRIPVIHSIDGYNLEKWFVKTLINFCTIREQDLIAFDDVLAVLFQNEQFKKPYGLNVSVKVGMSIDTQEFITFRPLSNIEGNNKELVGGLFTFRGFKFIVFIPFSKQLIVEDNLNFGDMDLDWQDLYPSWKHQEILLDGKKGKNTYTTQKIIFNWNKD